MAEQLQYLQPQCFMIDHNGFNYEVIACHEYYPDESESSDPMSAIDFTGNY